MDEFDKLDIDIPEIAILAAMGAYENFAKRIVMGNRGILTKSQADVMMGLALFGTMSMTQISEHLAVSKEQATRAVTPLVELGWVRRERNPDRRRIVEISLTEKGAESLEESSRIFAEAIRSRLEKLDEEDRQRLVEASRTAAITLKKTWE